MTDEKWGSPDGKAISGHAGPLTDRLPEVSGMGVAVGGEKSNRQAALEALDRFDGMTFNGNIEAWQKLGQLLDGHRNTILAALKAQDVNAVDNKTGNE